MGLRLSFVLLPFVIAGCHVSDLPTNREIDPTRVDLTTSPQAVTLAVIGDTGMDKGFEDVLRLIKSQKADAVLHVGDLGYSDRAAAPARWMQMVDAALGPDLPYFVTVGNHDVDRWNTVGGYQTLLSERLSRLPAGTCVNAGTKHDLGIKTLCTYKGLGFVLSGAGTTGSGHPGFVGDALKRLPEGWKICAWHKNQHEMQVGTKTDEVGWDVYKTCARHGAMILTGHEHSYARSLTLSDIGNTFAKHGAHGRPDEVVVSPGSTFVVVSGLGGRSERAFACDKPATGTWWASILAANYQMTNGAVVTPLDCLKVDEARDPEFGALFIRFKPDGASDTAHAEFITTSGRVVDRFTILKK